MPQDPGKSHGSLGNAVLISQLLQGRVQFGELLVIQEAASKEAVLQRRPGLDGDFVQSAVIQDATISVHAGLVIHVHIDTGLDHGSVHDAELELISAQRHIHSILQQLHLVRILVGNTEMANLASVLQLRKCLCHLFRLHQRIGTMQQQHIDILHTQALQAAVHRTNNVLIGKIKLAGADAALGLDDEVLPQCRRYSLAEHLFALAAAIDICMVKEITAMLQGGVDKGGHLFFVHIADAHAANSNGRHLHAAFAKLNFIHRNSPFCFFT